MSELPDHHLIARTILYDDHHAFKHLVLRYQSDIRCLLLRLTHGNQALTQELAQQTFIRAYRYIKKYKSQAKFSTWLYRICFNLFKTHYARNHQPTTSSEVKPLNIAKADSQADYILHRIDINNALQKLTTNERMVVLLYFDKDMTHSEIAEVMEIPIGTVKSHIARAKEKLKKILTPKYI